MARRLQRDDDMYEQNLYPVRIFCEDEDKEEYQEESLFYDTDNGEDANVVIEDQPIFDEEDENDVEYIDFIGIDKFFILIFLKFLF